MHLCDSLSMLDSIEKTFSQWNYTQQGKELKILSDKRSLIEGIEK